MSNLTYIQLPAKMKIKPVGGCELRYQSYNGETCNNLKT